MSSNLYSPGETCPQSGQWAIINANLKPTGTERTCVRNEPFPPTPQQGQRYRLADPTKH